MADDDKKVTPESLTEPVNSAQKGKAEQRAENKGPREGTQVPVEIDHGQPDPRVAATAEAQREALKDPWGQTPLQSRDSHDPAVDPQNEDAAGDVLGVPAASGIEPGITNEARADEHKVQGTLPPV